MIPSTPHHSVRRPAWIVTLLCWLIVVFDGYDLIVFGTTVPHLLNEPGWQLTKSTVGFIGSLAFVGMLIGALGAGYLADRFGRRRTILCCALWFSLFTALCAFAPNREIFGLFRLVAGLGLGGLVPSANALTAEYVSSRTRSVVATVMMSGVPIGGSLAVVIGLRMLPAFGWRSMYAVAVVAVVVLLPLCWLLLPESPAWLRSNGRAIQAEALEQTYGLTHAHAEIHDAEHKPGIGSLLKAPFTAPTIFFSAATLATLFAWYGLGTWLPQLMRESGFDLGNALGFLLALNLGAVLGSVVTAWAGFRFGPMRSAIAAAAVAALALLFLLSHPGTTGIYAALVLAGVGTHGTQCLIIAAIASHYPSRLRGTSLGFALGVGRIGAVAAPAIGGWLLAAGYGVDGNFLVFALAAAAASVLLLAGARHAKTHVPTIQPRTTEEVPA